LAVYLFVGIIVVNRYAKNVRLRVLAEVVFVNIIDKPTLVLIVKNWGLVAYVYVLMVGDGV